MEQTIAVVFDEAVPQDRARVETAEQFGEAALRQGRYPVEAPATFITPDEPGRYKVIAVGEWSGDPDQKLP
jgi:hypothetical protein